MIGKAGTWWVRAIAFACAAAIGWASWGSAAEAYNEEERLLLQAWRIVNQAYLDDSFNGSNWWFVRREILNEPHATREQTYEAIETMLAKLDDPFTRLLRPDQYRTLQVNTSGELSGVGLQINLNAKTDRLEVVAPVAGSPADLAGLAPKDQIVAIDGVATDSLALDEAAMLMRGPVGTRVTLTVRSPATDSELREVELVRDRIELNPVTAKLEAELAPLPVGYIRLTQFSANAAEEIAQAVSDLEARGAQGLVLDLRNNPGGLLTAGVEIARLWLDRGTIVYTVNRQGALDSYEAAGDAITDVPLAVLVNAGSASASEILAGALQDNGRAIVVGEQTFGKGLIQSLFELPDRSGMAVTVAKYETPNHTDINEMGIAPDYMVSQGLLTAERVATAEDAQYRRAIELLVSQSVVANAA